MQIVSNRDKLHEMSKPVFWGKKTSKPVLKATCFKQSSVYSIKGKDVEIYLS